MTQRNSSDSSRITSNFSKMFESFGKAMAEIFDDPELKKKAKEMGDSVAQSAQTFARRFKDEDVKQHFKEAGKAAQDFGDSVADYFGVGHRQKRSRKEEQQGPGTGDAHKEGP